MSIIEKKDCFVTTAKVSHKPSIPQGERHYPKRGLCEIIKARRLENNSDEISKIYSPWNRRPTPANRIWKSVAPAE